MHEISIQNQIYINIKAPTRLEQDHEGIELFSFVYKCKSKINMMNEDKYLKLININ